jgi:ABC-type glutathione transport system ATPase component
MEIVQILSGALTLISCKETIRSSDGRAKRAAALSRGQRMSTTNHHLTRTTPSQDKAQALIDVEGLGKRYHVRQSFSGRRSLVQAFRNINLRIFPAKTLALIGESGAGKSTLGRCLAFLERPTRGTIWFEGRRVTGLKKSDLSPLRRRVQLVFQDPTSALNPRMTAEEIIAEPLAIQKEGTRTEWHERAAQLIEQVGLPRSWLAKRPLEFSAGQRQRLAIARALALEPMLLVVDEAWSGLDLLNQDLILRLFARLQATRSLAYLYISPDLELVSRYSDQVAVMYQGEIVEQKPTRDLFAHPEHPYTRELLAAMPPIESIYRERFG